MVDKVEAVTVPRPADDLAEAAQGADRDDVDSSRRPRTRRGVTVPHVIAETVLLSLTAGAGRQMPVADRRALAVELAVVRRC